LRYSIRRIFQFLRIVRVKHIILAEGVKVVRVVEPFFGVGVWLYQNFTGNERNIVIVFRHRAGHIVGDTTGRDDELDVLFEMTWVNELDSTLEGIKEFESYLQHLAAAGRVGLQVRDLKPAPDDADTGWLKTAGLRESIIRINVLARFVNGKESTHHLWRQA
jgi:hypothetical protein